MKILFTNSPLHYTHGQVFTQADWQTLVLPLLAAIVKDHDVRLVDNMTLRVRSNRIMDEVKSFDPHVVGFSIIAARDIYNTLRIIKQVRQKSPQKILIAGGQGASFYDELLVKNGIDFVVKQEGEDTLKELIEAIDEKTTNYSFIKGIAYLKNGVVFTTDDRPKIKDLDESPFPAFELMPERKSKWFPNRITGGVEMSRGCPYDCNFCAITSFWEGSYRKKSNDRILEEIKILARQGRTHLYLADDNFGMGEKKHTELFERILEEELDIRFFAQMRTDTIAEHPEMIELAARAGLYGVLIGFDTYEEETFHHVTKVGSVELNIRCAEVLRKNKIMIYGSHIYALPSQKKPKDFARTFWMGRKYSDLFRMPQFSLLPGTKVYGKMISDEIIEEAKKGKGDFRLLLRTGKVQKKFNFWYLIFNWLNILLPDEIFGAIFHKNKNVRLLKRFGYIGIIRHWIYRLARKINLTEI